MKAEDSMKREDLRVRRDYGPLGKYEEVTDADLAALGYVKLDVDVERIWKCKTEGAWFVRRYQACANHDGEWVYVIPARQVLAAFEGEDT